jgi:hypothetical protein
MRKLLDALVRAAAPAHDAASASSDERPLGGREHDNCFPAAITPAAGCYPRAETAADPCFPARSFERARSKS